MKPYYGHEITIEVTAGEDIPYYYLTKFHATDKTKVVKATAGSIPNGVSVPSEDSMGSDGAGGIVPKTQWKSGEKPTIYDKGVVYVKLGETVTAMQKCVPGSTAGLAYAQDEPTFTDAAIATHDDAQINAAINGLIDEIQAARTSDASVLGEFMVGGDAGDIVPMKITQ